MASSTILFAFTRRTHLPLLAAAIILSALVGMIQPAFCVLVGRLMNLLSRFAAGSIDGSSLENETRTWIFGLVILGSTAIVLRSLFHCTWVAYGELQARVVREHLFSSLVVRDYEWFETQAAGVASLMSRIQTQIREFQHSVSQPLGLVILTVFQTIVSSGVALYYNWRLTLVLLAVFPFMAAGISLPGRGLQGCIDDQRREMANATKQSTHTLTNVVILRCYNGISKELQSYERILRLVARHYRRQTIISAKQTAFMRFAGNALVIIALFYGTNLIHNYGADSGAVLSTFWCCGMISKGFHEIVTQLLVLEKGRASASALQNLMHRVDEGKILVPQSSSRMLHSLMGEISFQDVSFAYPSVPHLPVLRRLNLTFEARQTTFVIGRSGSGKSTLGQLVVKLYAPDCGQIMIDSKDLCEIDTNWLRNNVTVVRQESTLFKDSLGRNIALGHHNPDGVDDKQIQQSVQLAVLGETVRNLPHGINSMVGHSGSLLSGGQKQRVAIARARLRDAPILILDESTSALDHSTMISLLNNVRDWRRDKTTIIITHDLSQIDARDRVCILEGGTVVAQGLRCEVDSLVEWPAWASDDAVVKKQECVDLHGENSTPIMFKHSDASETSFLNGFDSRPDHDRIALLHQDERKQPVKQTDRGRSFRALLKGREIRPPRFKARERRSHCGSTMIIQDLEYENSSPRKSRAMGNRLTLAQAIRPYSIYPTLSACHGDSGGDVHPTGLPEEIANAISIEKMETSAEVETASEPNNSTLTVLASPIWSIVATIWPSLTRFDQFQLICAVLMCIIYGAVPSLVSWMTVHLFQTFHQADGWFDDAQKWSLLMTAVSLVEATAAFFIHFIYENLGQSWTNTLRHRALKSVSRQPKAWFDEEVCPNSHICAILDRGAEEMRNIMGRFIPFTIIAIVMVLVAILWCLISCWKLTLACVGCLPVVYIISKIYQITASLWETRTTDAANIISEIFAESFRDICTVRALTLEFYFHRKFMMANLQAFLIGVKRGLLVGLCFGLSESIIVFISAGVFQYAIKMAQAQAYTMQSILFVLSSMILTMMGASAILSFIPQMSSSVDSGDRILQLLNLKQREISFRGDLELDADEFDGSIELHDFSFWYPSRPQMQILKNLNLVILPSSFTSIVGASGSGKSTILSLILGLYIESNSLQKGSIKISGHSLRDFNEHSLRSFIAYAPQQPVLFPTTIRENILYGVDQDTTLSDNSLHSAAKRADIHDFIMGLPEEYDTVIGDGGMTVSGGQAQRIAIARALARQPRILLMDEPTSALDPESATVIRTTIRTEADKAGKDTTVVVVTHSEEMMKAADNVVVLDAGRVVEYGSYESLMRKGGRLRALLNN